MNSASVQTERDGEAERVSRLSLILSSAECEKAVGDQNWVEGFGFSINFKANTF